MKTRPPLHPLRRIAEQRLKADYVLVVLECGHRKTYRRGVPRRACRCDRCRPIG